MIQFKSKHDRAATLPDLHPHKSGLFRIVEFEEGDTVVAQLNFHAFRQNSAELYNPGETISRGVCPYGALRALRALTELCD